MNVLFKYGANSDKGNFVEHGLRDKLKTIGKKALGDKIYNGHPNEISTFNAFGCDAVTKFKACAKMDHEKFNGKMKEFQLIQVKFCSPDDEYFEAAFEAIAVLVQYIFKHGDSFFYMLPVIEMEE